MSFRTIRALASSLDDAGANWTQHFFKTGGPASFGASRWGDMSMGAGNPKYNAYVGTQFASTPLQNAGNDGIYLGPTPAAGQTKHLHSMMLQSSSTTLAPAHFVLCDYLMHYPLIDGDDTAQQDLDNVATLPRYATGEGVKAMIVCTTPMTSNGNVVVSYTNSDGTAGRTSTSAILNTTVVGGIVSSADTSLSANSYTPFIPLAGGDKGIRSIEAITNQTAVGGFYAVVLVRPIASIQLRELNTATEIELFRQRGGTLPQIFDGAYLNWIYTPGQNGTAVNLRGSLTFVWG